MHHAARGKAAIPALVGLGTLICFIPSARAAQTLIVQGHDSPAIAAAIARAGDDAVVRLPAGTYDLTASIKPKSKLHLLGADQKGESGKTILRFTGDNPGTMIDVSRCADVEIANLTLDGNHNPAATQAIAGSSAQRLHLHGLTVHDFIKGKDFGPHGVYFSANVTDCLIEDCTFEHIGAGAEFGGGIRMGHGSSRNRVLRNSFNDCGRGGIFGSDGSTDLVIVGNTVTGSTGEGLGIELWHDCDRGLIENNRVDHWISIDGSNGSAIRRNTVSDKTGSVKYCGLELVNAHDCVFTDNVVDDGQWIGISQSGKEPKEHILWARNRITNCRQWGAQLQGEAGGVIAQYFYQCQFTGTFAGKSRYPNDDGHGIRINGNVHGVTFEECISKDNGRQGVQLFGKDVDALTFVRCTIEGNKGPAVTGPTRYESLRWIDCIVRANSSDALPKEKPFAGPAPRVDVHAPAAARAGEPTTFVASAATPDAKIQWLWDFGDGLPATGAEAVHTFTRPGNFDVTTVGWDEFGQAVRVEKQVIVSSTIQPQTRP